MSEHGQSQRNWRQLGADGVAAEVARAIAAVELAAGAGWGEDVDAGIGRRAAAMAMRPGQLIVPWSCLHAWAAAEQVAETALMNSVTLPEVRLSRALAVPGAGPGWLGRGDTDGQGVPLGDDPTDGARGTWLSVVRLAHAAGRDAVVAAAADAAGGTADAAATGPAAGWFVDEEEEMWWEQGGGAAARMPAWLADPQQSHPASPDAASTWGSVLAVLLVYARVHLRRQVHYLRVGMMGLFLYTGDLDDAVAAVLWTSTTSLLAFEPFVRAALAVAGLCFKVREGDVEAEAARLTRAEEEQPEEEPAARVLDEGSGKPGGPPAEPRRPCGATERATSGATPRGRTEPPPRAQATASHCVYLSAVVFGFCSALALGLGVCIAVPEFFAEIVRVGLVRRVELRSPGSSTLARILAVVQGSAD